MRPKSPGPKWGLKSKCPLSRDRTAHSVSIEPLIPVEFRGIMVFSAEEGGIFEAPIDRVRKYFDDESHDRAHPKTRAVVIEPGPDSSFILSADGETGGQWHREKEHTTLLRRLGYTSEVLEGTFAGSKWVLLCRPEGRRTRVDICGDLVSSLLSAEIIEHGVRKWFEQDLNEDAPRLRLFAAAKQIRSSVSSFAPTPRPLPCSPLPRNRHALSVPYRPARVPRLRSRGKDAPVPA